MKILEEFSFGEIVSILEHDGREKYNDDYISNVRLSYLWVVLEKIGKPVNKQANDDTYNDSYCGFLEIVELDEENRYSFVLKVECQYEIE